MAITAIHADFSREKCSNSLTQTTIKATYIIETDSDMLPSEVMNTTFTGKPTQSTDTHSYVTNAYLQSVDNCEQIDGVSSPWKYKYEVTFITPDADQPQPQADPEDEPPQIDWGGSDTTATIYFDQDGTAIENKAKQAYTDMPQVECGDAAVTITRIEGTNNAAAWNNYSYSINNATWYGNAAYTCKLGRISARKFFRGSTGLWQVSYPIFFRSQVIDSVEYGWRLRALNAGYCKLVTDGDDTFWVELTDRKGNKFTNPVPLSSDGTGILGDFDDKVYTTYKLYKEKTWSTLALPTPF